MRQEKWNKLFGNQFSQNISWQMLCDGGYVVTGKYYFIGEPKPAKKNVEESEIVYDREYVAQYIARKVISPLQPENFQELTKVLSDAWKFYKDNLR